MLRAIGVRVRRTTVIAARLSGQSNADNAQRIPRKTGVGCDPIRSGLEFDVQFLEQGFRGRM